MVKKDKKVTEGYEHGAENAEQPKSIVGMGIVYLAKTFSAATPIFTTIILALSVHMYYESEKRYDSLSGQIYNLGQGVTDQLSVSSGKLDIISNRTKTALSVASTAGAASLSPQQRERIEQMNMQADKYYIVVLTREIMDNIDNTVSFKTKLDELEAILEGKHADYINQLRTYQEMNMLSFDEMAKVVEDATVVNIPGLEQEQGLVDDVKGFFKVSSTSSKNDLKIKCNPIVIDSAIKALNQKNEWEALQALKDIEPKNDDLKRVVENLSTRNTIKFYLRDIGDQTLKKNV